MKNNKYKKALALVLSASLVMPCHATKPQYTQNPNTGLHVKRAEPSPEDTQNREQPHPNKNSKYGTAFWGMLGLAAAFGVGAIATRHHNNIGATISFNRRKDLVKNYDLPANSFDRVRLNKLRVYVHKDLCEDLCIQRILYVKHVENKVLPNITSGDFFPCATHMYLNNKCISDGEFKAEDYKLISDDHLKMDALRCVWGLKIQDDFPKFLATIETDELEGRKEKNNQEEITFAIELLEGFKKQFNDSREGLKEVFGSIRKPKKLVEGHLAKQLSEKSNPYVQCGNFIAELERWIAECTRVINVSRAPEILNRYQNESDLKEQLTQLENLLNTVVEARAFCDNMIVDCAKYCSALFTSSSIPSIGLHALI